MKVCIAEKPSVGREIAQIIGATTRHDGYLEGNGYQVTWTFGHFCTLYAPEDYRPEWKYWSLDNLPMLPQRFETKLMDDTGVQRQFEVIQRLVSKAELVINCGDAGQEGELIQRWVLKQTGYRGPVQRLWISSLTAEAIREGFARLSDAAQFDKLYHAGSSRAIGDWLLGMNATRLYTRRYGSQKQILSIGRVQTPTLAMLVERHKEIQNFRPEAFWELHTLYRDTPFACETSRFDKKETAQHWLEQVQNQPFRIVETERKEAKEGAPLLFDLTSLQVFANNKFGFSAEHTLKTLQNLYEKKLVSYPRVDTNYLPNDLYPKIPQIWQQLGNYADQIAPLQGKAVRKSSKVFNDTKVTDHHAIIPTGVQASLYADEQSLYHAIVLRFLAVFYPDCLVAKTTVRGVVGEIAFRTTGKEILHPGWRALYPQQAPTDENPKDEEERVLPHFETNEEGPHQPSLAEKQTSPPKPYTEATLLRAMETAGKKVEDEELRSLMKANGIGRPSTRANIIETLFKRNYIRRNKKQLLPTETGIQLIDLIQNKLLKSAELTGQWEKHLREIEDGTYSPVQFIENMKHMVQQLVYEVRSDSLTPSLAAQQTQQTDQRTTAPATQTEAAPQHIACPQCQQGQLLRGKQSYGCSRWREGCTLRIPFVFLEKKLTDKQVQQLCAKGKSPKIKGFVVEGKSQEGILSFDAQFGLVLHPTEGAGAKEKKTPPAAPDTQLSLMQDPSEGQVPDPLPCPRCGQGHIVRGKTAYGCSAWQSGCTFRYPYDALRQAAAGQPLTKVLVWALLRAKG